MIATLVLLPLLSCLAPEPAPSRAEAAPVVRANDTESESDDDPSAPAEDARAPLDVPKPQDSSPALPADHRSDPHDLSAPPKAGQGVPEAPGDAKPKALAPPKAAVRAPDADPDDDEVREDALPEPAPKEPAPALAGDTPAPAEVEVPVPVRFGASLSAGLPSGLELAPFVRPLSWLQLEASVAHDSAAFGVGGGVTVGALSHGFTPTLSLTGGHFFEGDLRGQLGKVSGVDLTDVASARQFDFDHVDGQVGLLAGSTYVQFFVRGGLSWMHATLHEFADTLRATSGDVTLDAGDPTVTAWVPSARLGLQVTF